MLVVVTRSHVTTTASVLARSKQRSVRQKWSVSRKCRARVLNFWIGRMTNLEIEKALALAARCDIRTARKALEHGYGTIRRRDVRDRVAFAMRQRPDLGMTYSKDGSHVKGDR